MFHILICSDSALIFYKLLLPTQLLPSMPPHPHSQHSTNRRQSHKHAGDGARVKPSTTVFNTLAPVVPILAKALTPSQFSVCSLLSLIVAHHQWLRKRRVPTLGQGGAGDGMGHTRLCCLGDCRRGQYLLGISSRHSDEFSYRKKLPCLQGIIQVS